MELMILAGIVAAAWVSAYASVSPEQRARTRAKPGFWADAEHCR